MRSSRISSDSYVHTVVEITCYHIPYIVLVDMSGTRTMRKRRIIRSDETGDIFLAGLQLIILWCGIRCDGTISDDGLLCSGSTSVCTRLVQGLTPVFSFRVHSKIVRRQAHFSLKKILYKVPRIVTRVFERNQCSKLVKHTIKSFWHVA